jgi:glutamate-1-semialdehyde 2,1-aminomutase
MQLIAPSGPVYQAGTLSGNPLAMTAGIATLKALQSPDVWVKLEQMVDLLSEGLEQAAKDAGVAIHQNRIGTMFSLFFTDKAVHDWSSAKLSDTNRFASYFQSMLEQGIYLAPSQFEAGFMSTVHGPDEIQKTILAARKAFKQLA